MRERLLVVASVVALLLGVPATAHAGKSGDSTIGQFAPVTGTAADGGLFNGPADIAVNQQTGQIFVVDQDLQRIQRLDADGSFELAWGRNVVQTGAPNDLGAGSEVCAAVGPATPNTASDCQAGTTGISGGEFWTPEGVAVDPDTGHVFVTDRDNLRVQEFSFDANDLPVFERAWGWDVVVAGGVNDDADATPNQFEVCIVAIECKRGATGAGMGQIGAVLTIEQGLDGGGRLDVTKDGSPAAGAVVVADPGNRRVQLFDFADLAAVAPPSGPEVFGSAARFATEEPKQVAIDANGVVYANDLLDSTLERYDTSSGTFLTRVEQIGDQHPGGGFVAQYGVEIDPVNGNLLRLEDKTSSGTTNDDTLVFEFADPGAPQPPTAVADLHMRGSGDVAVDGLGVHHTANADRLYVSGHEQGPLGQRILVLDADGAGPIGLSPATPDILGPNAVTLKGFVDPNGPTGFATRYHFEYMTDGPVQGSWTRVEGSPLADPDGAGPQEVTASVSDLEANTPYKLRMVATREYGAALVTTSAEVNFVTAAAPPVVTTLAAAARTAGSARLLGRLNPQNSDTEWHFEYVRESEFQASGWTNAISTPTETATGGAPRLVNADVDGLAPGERYRYRLVATNGVPVDPDCAADCDVVVEGDAVTFAARDEVPAPAGRGYEMVTAPEKVNRRGEDGRGRGVFGIPGVFAVPGLPSADGESLLFGTFGTILDPESGSQSAHMTGWEVRHRTATGWNGEAVANVPTIGPGGSAVNQMLAVSPSLDVQAWRHLAYLFPSGSRLGVRVMSDNGGLDGSGWYPWLLDQSAYPWLPQASPTLGEIYTGPDAAIASDDLLVRWGASAAVEGAYTHLLGPDDPSRLQTDGAAPYVADASSSWRPRDLVSACSGAATPEVQQVTVDATGGTFTLTLDGRETIPITYNASAGTVRNRLADIAGDDFVRTTARSDIEVVSSAPGSWTVTFARRADGLRGSGDVPEMTGQGAGLTGGASSVTVATTAEGAAGTATLVPARHADGTIGELPCPEGGVSSSHGAIPGGRHTPITAISEDNGRIFFTSPDPAFEPPVCTASTDAATHCPPQLYVRQYNPAGGSPTTRWISRSEITGQAETLLREAAFEGASLDGRYVFFRTSQPLVADDPNGGQDPTSGTASEKLLRPLPLRAAGQPRRRSDRAGGRRPDADHRRSDRDRRSEHQRRDRARIGRRAALPVGRRAAGVLRDARADPRRRERAALGRHDDPGRKLGTGPDAQPLPLRLARRQLRVHRLHPLRAERLEPGHGGRLPQHLHGPLADARGQRPDPEHVELRARHHHRRGNRLRVGRAADPRRHRRRRRHLPLRGRQRRAVAGVDPTRGPDALRVRAGTQRRVDAARALQRGVRLAAARRQPAGGRRHRRPAPLQPLRAARRVAAGDLLPEPPRAGPRGRQRRLLGHLRVARRHAAQDLAGQQRPPRLLLGQHARR